jgi:hypothetical protein
MREIKTFTGEGFTSTFSEEMGRVFGKADFDIDADGANGQGGGQPAYMVGNKGSEHLGNGGMKMEGDRVVFSASWGKDIVFVRDGRPLVLPGGVIPSRTAYSLPDDGSPEWERQIDSETVPYIVVQKDIIAGTEGAVMGCKARATYKGKSVDCIVADVGPRAKIGEGSIALARALGIPHSPRTGGLERAEVLYELWPGVHGEIAGRKIPLRTSSGRYINPPA